MPSKVERVVARPGRKGARATDAQFPEALAAWITRDGDLVEALVALRRLGAEGADALQAALPDFADADGIRRERLGTHRDSSIPGCQHPVTDRYNSNVWIIDQ